MSEYNPQKASETGRDLEAWAEDRFPTAAVPLNVPLEDVFELGELTRIRQHIEGFYGVQEPDDWESLTLDQIGQMIDNSRDDYSQDFD